VYDPGTRTWTTTNSLFTARADHTATLLSSGKVLVTGGYGGPNVYLTSAEVYDPNAGTWSPTGPMAWGRDRHTATLLPSGKVLVTGGFRIPGGELTSAELYDPDAETWSITDSLVEARSSHTATLLPSGKVLITGGKGPNGTYVSSAEVYTPGTGWSAAGSLSIARYSHTATLLPSGKVLVTGGNDSNEVPLVDMEEYAPDTEWSSAGALDIGRNEHTATLLPSGQVLLTGGTGTSGPLTTVEVYRSPGASRPISDRLAVARAEPMAVLLPNGKVLVVGGSGSSGPLAHAELFDPALDKWSATAPLSTPRASATATLLPSGQVLVVGGSGLSGNGLRAMDAGAALSTAELYNPVTNTWRSTKEPLRGARHSHSALLLPSGEVLVTGGVGTDGAPLSTAEVYDPINETWTSTEPMDTPRQAPMVIQLPTGQVLATGGLDADRNPLSSAEVYDLTSRSWTSTAPMDTARAFSTAALLPSGKVLVAGGAKDKDRIQVLSSAEVYNPQERSWSAVGPLHAARQTHSAHLLPTGKVLVIGGSNNGTPLDEVEVYDPAEETWERKTKLSEPREGSTTVLLPSGQVLVIGGRSSAGLSSSTEQYDEQGTSGTARPIIAPLPPQRPEASLTLRGNGLKSTTDGAAMVRLRVSPRGELLTLPVQDLSDESLRITLPPMPEGYHLLFVLKDGIAGGQILRVDGTPPEAPTVEEPGAWVNIPWPLIAGTAEPGSTVNVFLDGHAVGEATANTWGAWSFNLAAPLESRTYLLTATATDEARNTSQHSVAHSFTVDTVKPEAPIMNHPGAWLNDSRPTLDGRAEPLCTVTVFLNGNKADTVRVDEQGGWSFTPATALPDGEHTVWATARDKAGNMGPASAQLRFTVDAQAPKLQVLMPEEGDVVATPRPVIQGSTEPHSRVKVFLDGQVAGTAMADSMGTWTFIARSTLENGMHTVSALSTDAAGNNSQTVAHSFTVDRAITPVDMGCAAGPGEPSLVLLGLMALGRLVSRHCLARAKHLKRTGRCKSLQLSIGGSSLLLLVCIWLGCSPPEVPAIAGFHGEDSHAGTAAQHQHPQVTPGAALSPSLSPFMESSTWTSIREMRAHRYNHTATLLPDGKVLVVGGLHATDTLVSAELYDLNTGVWAATQGMITPRFNHTATLLPDGKVLVTGGLDSEGKALDSVEVYNPADNSWAPQAQINRSRMNRSRSQHTATLLPNGKVLVAGGTTDGVIGLNDVELYDPQTESWRVGDSMHYPRFGHTATLLPDGGVLVAGGSFEKEAEQYTGTSWKRTGALSAHRRWHTATLLLPSSGKVLVLVAGGVGDRALESAELLDLEAGTWRSSTEPMRQARYEHTAVLLPSGKVLVAGGQTGSLSGLTSVEQYDPENDTWSSSPPLIPGRFKHTATLLPSGKVLLTGGWDPSGAALDSATVYDPGPGGWQNKAKMLAARSGHTVTLLPSGQLLATGGSNGTVSLKSVDLYDPVSDAWSPTKPLDTARFGHTATLLPSGKLLVAGGTQNGRSPLKSAELYDPKLGSWSPTGPLGTARFGHTATLLPSGKVLVAGGSDDSGPLNSAELYDPASGAWSPTGPLDTPRSGHTATLLPPDESDQFQVLVAGGTDSSPRSAELYHPELGTWSLTDSMKTPRSDHTATLLPSGKVLVAGGRRGAIVLSSAELYDLNEKTWSSLSQAQNTARYAHTATLLPSGQVLITGGMNASTALASAQVYDPALATWSEAMPLAAARVTHTATLLPTGQVLIAGGSSNDTDHLDSVEVYEGMVAPPAVLPRPVIGPERIPARKPGAELVLTGSHLHSFSEASGGNARSSGSTLPLISLIAVEGGMLTRVPLWAASSDTSLTLTLPSVPTGYYVLSLMLHGTAGGRLVLVDGTPPTPPQVAKPFQDQRFYTTSKPELAGTTELGSTVEVHLDEVQAEEVRLDPDTGAWRYTPPEPLELGTHTLSVTAIDEAGNRSESSVVFHQDFPRSRYGWNCSSGPAFPVSGIWLVVLWWLRRRGGCPPACPPG
jgi:N-acetylneuraminic acid mutarotase